MKKRNEKDMELREMDVLEFFTNEAVLRWGRVREVK